MEEFQHLRRAGVMLNGVNPRPKNSSEYTENTEFTKVKSNPGIILKKWIQKIVP